METAAIDRISLPRDIQTAKLANGVRIITETMPSVRSVSVGIWIGTGSRVERGAKTASRISSSTCCSRAPPTGRRRTSRARWIRIGGNLDAFTARNWSASTPKCWTSTCRWPSTCWRTWCCIRLFREEDIEKEKGVILEEIKMEADSPDYLVHEIFFGNFWKDHRWASRFWARENGEAVRRPDDPRFLQPQCTRRRTC